MANNFQRPIIAQGNDFYINIILTHLNEGDVENLDLSRCKSVEVYLICGVHNTRIDLDYTIPQSEHNNIINAFVDHRMLHNTSYGICVEGLYENDMHWRWYCLPKEGILVIPNTSGQNIPMEIEYIDVAGRVGFGDVDLSDYYTKEETNTILESYATETELQNYQPTLVSGENIKTINNQSILGEGNITIEGGGGTQVQANWNETDTTAPSYIQNKPDLTQYATQSDLSNYVQSSDLATVATTGNYSDLNGTPTIPAAQVQANWNESDSASMAYIQNKPTIQQPGFAQYTNNNKTGLVNTLSQYYNTNIGTGAVIEGDGYNNDNKIEASGAYSHAEGIGTIASGDHSHAEGEYNTATGANSHVEGNFSIANGYHSHSEGFNTTADNTGSHSEGMYTQASGEASHAEGESTTASGDFSHVEGFSTTASGIESHAEGFNTTASAEGSHSEGRYTQASGEYSHAEGYNTLSKNYAEHSSGVFNSSLEGDVDGTKFGSYSYTLFTVGNGVITNNTTYWHNALDIRQNGDIYIADTSQIDNTSYFYYNTPMIKLQDALSGGGSTQVQANWNETNSASMAYILNKPTIPAAPVQSDWNESDTNSLAYIQNKPTITTPDPTTGNAGQVLATNGTNYYFRNETEAMLISTSSGSTQTKRMSSSNIASLSMLQNKYFTVIISTDNTYVGEIKLRLYTDNTDTSGHTIYINGAVSSSTNYTLPKGSYTVYYDGTYYYFDTTGQIPFVPKSSTYNMKIEVVSALPVSPDSNTLYIVI